MGSNQFQKEYIEYLQERNAALIEKLNRMKDHYENKVLSRDFNKHYLISTLQDMSLLCTEIPQEIDLFFDKMTAAMNILKNVLLRKAEMVQLVEKISKAINSTECHNTDMLAVNESNLFRAPVSEIRSYKRSEMVKVSPMINGHVISTEPKVYLNRISDMLIPEIRRGPQQLSPIIEASPDVSSDTPNTGTANFKDISVPAERLNLNKPFNYDSPKSRFKGPKTWKKSLSSAKCQSESQRNLPLSENRENNNKKISLEEIENVDPLEGPSWLHNGSGTSSSPGHFMDYRRRKHRFATVFDKNEENNSSREGRSPNSSLKDEKGKKQQDDDHDGDETHDNDDDDDVDDDDDDYEEEEKKEDDKDGVVVDAFSENHDTNEDKENFPEFREKNRESSMDLFSEPFTNEFEERSSPSSEKISALIKRKELVLKLEDCALIKSSVAEESKTKRSKEKKLRENTSTGESKSPKLLVENEGRKKRKAAPTFRLVEPKLKTKLRRN